MEARPTRSGSRIRPSSLLAQALLAVLLTAGSAIGAEDNYIGPTPSRLSLIEGRVSFWRAGASEWQDAQVNLPLSPGDYLATGPESRLELQVGRRAFLRADAESQFGVDAQDGGLLRLRAQEGRLSLDVRDIESGDRIEIEAPDATLAASDRGFYDVIIDRDRTTFVAHQGGRAVIMVGDEDVPLTAGSAVIVDANGQYSVQQAAPPDAWVRWNTERTDRILTPATRGYVSEDIYGTYDLDTYGDWREEPQYGRVWVPRQVATDWAPYSAGRWVWDVDYGWSWVDNAPWGWAPYHYGRWVRVRSYWAWAPGPVVVRPVYSPALVAFFGSPGGVNVGIGIGAPAVSWVALGWGEPVVPWWGPTYFRRRPCWNGWGGPTIVNNIHVDRRTFINVREIRRYHNQEYRDAVIGVRRDQFGRRQAEHFRVDDDHRRHLRPVRSEVPVKPQEVGVRPVDRKRARTERPPRADQLLRDRPQRERPARERPQREPHQQPGRGQPAAGAPDARHDSGAPTGNEDRRRQRVRPETEPNGRQATDPRRVDSANEAASRTRERRQRPGNEPQAPGTNNQAQDPRQRRDDRGRPQPQRPGAARESAPAAQGGEPPLRSGREARPRTEPRAPVGADSLQQRQSGPGATQDAVRRMQERRQRFDSDPRLDRGRIERSERTERPNRPDAPAAPDRPQRPPSIPAPAAGEPRQRIERERPERAMPPSRQREQPVRPEVPDSRSLERQMQRERSKEPPSAPVPRQAPIPQSHREAPVPRAERPPMRSERPQPQAAAPASAGERVQSPNRSVRQAQPRFERAERPQRDRSEVRRSNPAPARAGKLERGNDGRSESRGRAERAP